MFFEMGTDPYVYFGICYGPKPEKKLGSVPVSSPLRYVSLRNNFADRTRSTKPRGSGSRYEFCWFQHGGCREFTNLVPRSHSVTGNVRSGEVRQYTIFHWLLKKVAAIQSTLRLAYFAEHLVKVRFSQSHVLFWINASCAVESFVFSYAGKALQLRKIILNICDICVNGTDESPTYPATRIKFCVAGYAVRRN